MTNPYHKAKDRDVTLRKVKEGKLIRKYDIKLGKSPSIRVNVPKIRFPKLRC